MKYQTTTFLGFCALFIALPLGDLLADTLHVPRPYGTIQAAIEVAENGDVIVIAADTYSPTATIDTLGKAITLRGAVDRQGLPTTIIDGRGKMRVLQCVNNEGAGTVFQNLIITGGRAEQGGGLYLLFSGPTLENCHFQGNTAEYEGGEGGGVYCSGQSDNDDTLTFTDCSFTGNSTGNGDPKKNDFRHGGGLCLVNSSLTLDNCRFEDNQSDYGGGVYCSGQSDNEGLLTFTGCTFTDNEAEYSGGGVFCEYVDFSKSSDSATFFDCDFDGNNAAGTMIGDLQYGRREGGGGVSLRMCVYPPTKKKTKEGTLHKCRFTNNSAPCSGGLLLDESDQSQGVVHPLLTDCTFSENRCVVDVPRNGNGGGGIGMFRSRPTIRACDFEGNFVEFRGGNGKRGDIGGGGAMRTWFFSGGSTIQGNTVIEGCTFTNNIVSGGASGGAILYAAGGDHDYPKITGFGRQRCQFTGNSALDGHGGAVFNIGPGGHPTFSNCDFEDNSADSGGGMYNSYSSPTLNDCTFAGNWAVDKGGGMYNLDHSKPSLERCTFTGNSAAEGGGIYSDKTSGPTLHYTIVCGNSPDQIYGNWTDEGGNTVYHTSPDLNDDGAVNGADVGLFLVEWGSRGDCLPADFNGDGQVDGADFGLLLLAWTG